MRKLTMEKILAKFIDEGRREHEEMEIFIKEFRTTNELLLKTQSKLLTELKIEVNELSKVMSNVLIPKNEVKGVTTRGGKMTSKAARSKEINEQEVQEKPNDIGVENKSLSIPERTTQPLVKPQQSSIPFPNRSLLTNKSKLKYACTETINKRCFAVLLNELPLKVKTIGITLQPCQYYRTKETEVRECAAYHSSRIKNLHMKVLTEKEINDEFSDEHLMVLKSKCSNNEPWYADFVNYIVGKVIPPNWTFEKRNRGFSQVKTYFWKELYAFKLCADNIMRRCVAGSKTLKILAHCHSGPTGGHHSANVTAKKVYESGFYWPSIFKDANECVRRCDACQRSRNISSRNEMPQNNIQVCEVFDVCGLNFMGPYPEFRGNKYILVDVDYVSKWVEAQALHTNDARVVVKFLRQLFARFGVPKALISDRGTHFCNSQLEKALQRYGVSYKLSTTYHLQSNGQTKVTNRAIKRILERSVRYNPKGPCLDALSRKDRAKPLRVGALAMTINSNLSPQIHKTQVEALKKENVKDGNLHGTNKDFETRLDRTLCIRSRNWLSHCRDSRKLIRHGSQKNLTIPPTLGSDKTYHYLKQWYRWLTMESDIATYVSNHGHQRNYADMRRKPLEFQVGSKAMLKYRHGNG
ncbi:reverse transcriptase domain-containing protein [Tanacetum coccineum]